MKTIEEYEQEIAELKAGLAYREGQLEDCMGQIHEYENQKRERHIFTPCEAEYHNVNDIEATAVVVRPNHTFLRKLVIKTDKAKFTLNLISNNKENLDIYKMVTQITSI